jgi:3-oxoacyl-[acyl-carrier protein] reductase
MMDAVRERGGGYIITISSLAGKNALKGGIAYNASKFGLNGFTQALMLDVRHEGIRVSTIMPGSVDTSFGRGSAGARPWALRAEDVAAVVLHLLSHPARSLPSAVENSARETGEELDARRDRRGDIGSVVS